MAIAVLCPGCNARLNAPDSAAGKNVKCPKCATLMTIPSATADDDFEVVDDSPQSPGRAAPPPATRKPVKTDVMLDDDDDDDRPRRRRDDDDDDDDRPKKKKKGKKKAKSGGLSPGVMIAIAFGALLVLGGGGIGIYYATRDKSKETTSNTSGGGGGRSDSGGKAAPPAGWVSFSPPSGGFKVYMPIAPSFTPTPPPQPVRTITPLVYRSEDETALVGVQVQVLYFPPNMDETAKQNELQSRMQRNDGKKFGPGTGIRVVSESQDATLAGMKANELVLELDLNELLKDAPPQAKQTKSGRPMPEKITTCARAIVSGDRAYVVVLISVGRHPDEKAIFDNFELIPESGGAGSGDAPKPPPRGNPVRK